MAQVDVAVRTPMKALSSGVFQCLVGGALLAFSLSSMQVAVAGYRVDWWLLFLSVALTLMGWFFFATGIRRVRESLDKSFYVRAGPEGLSFRLPEGTWSSLLLGYRIIEESLPWSIVSKYYPYQSTVNGIPMASEVRVETLTKGRYSIPSLYFSTSREKLAEEIKRAAQGRDISVLDSLAALTKSLKTSTEE